MRLPVFLSALLAGLICTVAQAADVNVSVNIGQPGFFGRLDIGGYPEPTLLYPQPMMIRQVEASQPPLYLRVPHYHARHWRSHCHRYHACGERVFFVRDDWYRHQFAPRYREQHPIAPVWHDNRHDHRRDARNPWQDRHDARQDRHAFRQDRHAPRRDEFRGERGSDHRHDQDRGFGR